MSRPRIDIGLVVAGSLDEVDAQAVTEARAALRTELQEIFPHLEWRLSLVRREEAVSSPRVEPVELFDLGVEERDAGRWDFVMILTPADLVTHHKPFGFAVVSRVLDLAVISMQRIDPHASDPDAPEAERVSAVKRRLRTLLVHALGDLVGLEHSESAGNPMVVPDSLEVLDSAEQLDSAQREIARARLQQIADVRLEEAEPRKRKAPTFYPRAAWINRAEIAEGVWKARPWQFPIRLTKLTAAAISAMVVLLMTAETWELASHQPAGRLAALLTGTLALTTLYVARRQRLLVQRPAHATSEQIVTTNVSALLIVLVGLTTMTLVLFGASLAAGLLLFPESVASSWTTLSEPSLTDHLEVAVFITTVALVIGALGASFEGYYHFRHVTFVDEEL